MISSQNRMLGSFDDFLDFDVAEENTLDNSMFLQNAHYSFENDAAKETTSVFLQNAHYSFGNDAAKKTTNGPHGNIFFFSFLDRNQPFSFIALNTSRIRNIGGSGS